MITSEDPPSWVFLYLKKFNTTYFHTNNLQTKQIPQRFERFTIEACQEWNIEVQAVERMEDRLLLFIIHTSPTSNQLTAFKGAHGSIYTSKWVTFSKSCKRRELTFISWNSTLTGLQRRCPILHLHAYLPIFTDFLEAWRGSQRTQIQCASNSRKTVACAYGYVTNLQKRIMCS